MTASLQRKPLAFRTWLGELRDGTLTIRGCRTKILRDGDVLADGWEPKRTLKLHSGDRLLIGDADLSTNEHGFVVTPCDGATVCSDGRVSQDHGKVMDGRVHVVVCGKARRR